MVSSRLIRQAIGLQDILIRNFQCEYPSGYLFFTQRDAQYFVAGESELLKNEHVPVGPGKRVMVFEHEYRLERYGLRVGGFGNLPVIDLEAESIDVVPEIRFVPVAKVEKNIIIGGVDMVQAAFQSKAFDLFYLFAGRCCQDPKGKCFQLILR